MPHDLNKLDSYDHLKGTPKRAHEGSQSQGHLAGGNAGYTNNMSVGSQKGKMPESKGPGGMDM